MRDEHPVYHSVIRKLKSAIEALGPQRECFDRLDLENKGWDYGTFNAYVRGTRKIPGSLLARLVEYLGWDWAWNLAKDEQALIANTILWDQNTDTQSSIQAMLLYFCQLRQLSDGEAHDRFIESLAIRFPPEKFPLESVTALHGECLMHRPARKLPGDNRSPTELLASWWIRLRLQLGECESSGFFDSKLHVAVIRDVGVGLADISVENSDIRPSLVPHLESIKVDLGQCEPMLSTPVAWCFHLFSIIYIDVALGNREGWLWNLDRMRQVCVLEGTETEPGPAGLWVRFHLAQSCILDRQGDIDAADAELLAAANCMRTCKEYRWELEVRRQIEERTVTRQASS